jgi:hypothetical protein
MQKEHVDQAVGASSLLICPQATNARAAREIALEFQNILDLE